MKNQKLKGSEGTARKLSLPDCLMVEILYRLPSNSLGRLRFVSKEWKRIIAERQFIKLQMKPREKLSGFFFQGRYQYCDEDVKSISYVSVERESAIMVPKDVLNFLPEKENVAILSSNNGLVCCRSSFPCLNPVMYICNPLIREWRTIQWPNFPRDSSTALIFEPLKNKKIDVSTDFLVVTVCQTELDTEDPDDEDDIHFSFNVYSSQTNAWLKSKETCNYSHGLIKKGCAIVEGIVYWLTEGDHILMFDPGNEISCLVLQPFPVSELNFTPGMCIGEAEVKLQYVLISEDGLQVWELEDKFASQWALKWFISLKELENENPNCMYQLSEKMGDHMTTDAFPWFSPLSSKDTTLLLRISTDIYAFDFETKKAKLLCPVSALGKYSTIFPIVIPYTMSLVPLNSV